MTIGYVTLNIISTGVTNPVYLAFNYDTTSSPPNKVTNFYNVDPLNCQAGSAISFIESQAGGYVTFFSTDTSKLKGNTYITSSITGISISSNPLDYIFTWDTSRYYYNGGSAGPITMTQTPGSCCFSQGTKILCLSQYLKDEYRLVQDLMIGDFVKSYLHGYRKVSKILNGIFVNNPKDEGVSNCMYRMIKTDDNGLIEDLTLTRNHGVLVEKLSENEEKKVDKNNLPVIDNLLSIITADSDKFEKVLDTNVYKYYHFSLEGDGDDDKRFGVWANGILVEVPSNNMMDGVLNIKPLDF
jgi:hypothetical protein